MHVSFCHDSTCSQGAPIAMPLYAVAIAPLLQMIKSDDAQDVRHVDFADDLCGAGRLVRLRSWWDDIVVHGQRLGYYQRADKCWLIVKPHLVETVKKIFAGTDVRISTNGQNILVDTSTRRMSNLWLRGDATRFMY